MKGIDETTSARAANLSPALVKTYRAMFQEAKDTKRYAYRFDELARMAADEPADRRSSGKKGAK
jgi:hypothetical protein